MSITAAPAPLADGPGPTGGGRLAERLTLTHEPLGDARALEQEWRGLESRAELSFFQTWDWIGSIVDVLSDGPRPTVWRIRHGSTLVGVGLVWHGTRQRRGILRSRTLHLHETGVAEIDRVTVEHNDLVVAHGYHQAVVEAVLRGWAGRSDADELLVSGLRCDAFEVWQQAATDAGLWARTRWAHPYYSVDLEAIRTAGHAYIDAVGSNTRYHYRRAVKAYAQRGLVTLDHAGSLPQALEWLDALAALHQAQWAARGEPGAFGTPFQRRFHAVVVERGWGRGTVDLCRARAGDRVLGYLYNFRRNGTIWNYQSGHVSESDAKLKPGLVTHCLAVEDALLSGCGVYDLMVGGSHFKPSLTNAQGTMVWATFQQRRASLALEQWLREASSHWVRWRGAKPAPDSSPRPP